MYHRLLLNFIQRFSYLQQYLFILSLALPLLIIYNCWWCIFLLPLSTIFANYIIKCLSHSNQSPLKFSGYIYNRLFRKRSIKQDDHIQKQTLLQEDSTEILIIKDSQETLLEKEYRKYFQTIIARYICVWYYPLISTDQAFTKELENIFKILIENFIQHLKFINIYDLICLIINLKQKHLEQYLYTVDSFKKQRKNNRISQTIVEEFSQLIGFHHSIIQNDIHGYLRAIVELLITSLIPENLYIYSDSRPGREFLTQILVNCIFLPLLNEFSKPRMIYRLFIILLETEEEKKHFELNENSIIEQSDIIDEHQNEQQTNILIKHFNDQNNQKFDRRELRFEKIIYSANIISCDRAYTAMSGSAYTVYIIECETKSPYTSNAIHRYTIRRRFREFMNLHKRLQENPLTSRHCYGLNIDEVFRVLPMPMDNMNTDIINRRRSILDKYIKQLISNEVLNCSHDLLEFFAFNSDPNIQFEPSPPSKLPLPRVDKVLFRTLSGVGTKLNTLLPTKRETTPFRETFQLHISTTYENTSSSMEQLQTFVNNSIEKYSSYSLKLNSIDSEFLQSLLTRSSIVSSRRKEKIQSDIPLTDAILNLIHTCLHSRDAMISNEAIHQILRTIFGHFIEELLKNNIDDILSEEKILIYLYDLRTKILWPEENILSTTMKNVKHRAYNAFISRIPMWFQHIVGVENIRRIIFNLLQCLSHEELNRHFICNTIDLLIEKLIPNLASEEFLRKYIQMHSNIRT